MTGRSLRAAPSGISLTPLAGFRLDGRVMKREGLRSHFREVI